MECPFQVGDVVVCIKKDPWSTESQKSNCIHYPRFNQVLTIRKIRLAEKHPQIMGEAVLMFNELHNPLHSNGREYAFYWKAFRPARKTDISVFTALLKTKELTDG